MFRRLLGWAGYNLGYSQGYSKATEEARILVKKMVADESIALLARKRIFANGWEAHIKGLKQVPYRVVGLDAGVSNGEYLDALDKCGCAKCQRNMQGSP